MVISKKFLTGHKRYTTNSLETDEITVGTLGDTK